jgi:hypothetical protein
MLSYLQNSPLTQATLNARRHQHLQQCLQDSIGRVALLVVVGGIACKSNGTYPFLLTKMPLSSVQRQRIHPALSVSLGTLLGLNFSCRPRPYLARILAFAKLVIIISAAKEVVLINILLPMSVMQDIERGSRCNLPAHDTLDTLRIMTTNQRQELLCLFNPSPTRAKDDYSVLFCIKTAQDSLGISLGRRSSVPDLIFANCFSR